MSLCTAAAISWNQLVSPQTAPIIFLLLVALLLCVLFFYQYRIKAFNAKLMTLEKKQQLTFVHPFDEAEIIAGQGTLALEMLEDAPDLDCFAVPIGEAV